MSPTPIRCAAFAVQFVQALVVAASAADASPKDILTGIYKEAVKDTSPDWLDTKRRDKYLSKSLLELWARADAKKPPKGDVGPIDFDLTTDTNALELQGYGIKTESKSDNAAVLAVKLTYRDPYVHLGPPRVVTYDFIRKGRSWRIDDIRTKRWSVRDLLTLWLKGG